MKTLSSSIQFSRVLIYCLAISLAIGAVIALPLFSDRELLSAETSASSAESIAPGRSQLSALERTDLAARQAELNAWKSDALSGGLVSTRKLADYYSKLDFDQMQYWNLIGAKNGDPILQYNYAFFILQSRSPSQRETAIFWLKKASDSGDKDAAALLKIARRGSTVDDL